MKFRKYDIRDWTWVHPFPSIALARNLTFEGRHCHLIVCLTIWRTSWVLEFPKEKAE